MVGTKVQRISELPRGREFLLFSEAVTSQEPSRMIFKPWSLTALKPSKICSREINIVAVSWLFLPSNMGVELNRNLSKLVRGTSP
jgi:hypothetical protein